MVDTEKWIVIVVEDNEDSLQVVSQVLDYHNITIKAARNGLECLKLLEDLTPTMILMDLSMPEMDGWNTLASIRANPATAQLPVIALTAYHSSSVAEEAISAGFNAYFAKPIAAQSFVESLAGILAGM